MTGQESQSKIANSPREILQRFILANFSSEFRAENGHGILDRGLAARLAEIPRQAKPSPRGRTQTLFSCSVPA